jgi:hypothetical protein
VNAYLAAPSDNSLILLRALRVLRGEMIFLGLPLILSGLSGLIILLYIAAAETVKRIFTTF